MKNKDEMRPYKKKGHANFLKPPANFLGSVVKLRSWFALPREEQKAERTRFTKMNEDEKKRYNAAIPGGECQCTECAAKRNNRKSRSDKNKTRGPRARTTSNQDACSNNNNRGGPQAGDSDYFSSLAHTSSHRVSIQESVDGKAAWARRKASAPAGSVSQQGDIVAQEHRIAAMKAVAKAITSSTTEPVGTNKDSGLQEFDQSIPRNRYLLLHYKEVKDTGAVGGKRAQLVSSRLETPEMWYVSSSPKDAVFILDKINSNDGFSKKKIFGSGQAIHNKIGTIEQEWKDSRSRVVLKPSQSDTARSVSHVNAPAYEVNNNGSTARGRRRSA